MYREISPAKIIAKRGQRSRSEVVKDIDKLTEQDLYGYEKGLWKPSKDKLPFLLKALEATYDEISEPVELLAA
jgi:hypothetical protein